MRSLLSVLGRCLIFVLYPLALSAQTSIVAIMTTDSIVIGSDSKATTTDGLKATSLCKIGSTHGIFWAFSEYSRDTGLNFSVDVTVHKAMETKGSLAERVVTFEKMIKPELKRNIEIRMAGSGDEWFRARAEGKPVLEVLFAAFENEKPLLPCRTFIAHRVGDRIKIDSVTIPAPEVRPEAPITLALGHHETIDNMAPEEKASLVLNLGVEGAVRALVEKEIAACPKFVGPPIAVVHIYTTGPRWISYGSCSQPPGAIADIRNVHNTDSRCDEAP